MTTTSNPTIVSAPAATKSPTDHTEKIHSLESEKALLKASLQRCNTWYMIFTGITVLAAVGIFLSQRAALHKSFEIATVEEEVAELQRQDFDENLKAKDVEIGKATVVSSEANKEAKLANERATANEKEAEQLRKQLAPRTLGEEDRKALGEQLRQFAMHFLGRKVTVSSYSADAEGVVFALEIMDVLKKAGISVEPEIGRLMPVGLVSLGVKISGPNKDRGFVEALGKGINTLAHTRVDVQFTSEFSELKILIAAKPIPGLPEVIHAQ